jgi:hypothetical protein
MRNHRYWSVGALAVMVLPLFNVATRSPAPVPVSPPVRDLWDAIPWKCPGHMGSADSFPQLAVAGRITNIPEYHDCQRFVVNEKYDSLYAVFVSSNGRGVIDELKRLECSAGLVLANDNVPQKRPTEGNVNPLLSRRDTNVTVMEPSFTRGPANPETNCRAIPGGQWNLVGIALAEVVSWGGEYPSLGIKPYFNCLFVYDSDALKAVMVPVGRDDKPCTEIVDPTAVVGTQLRVRATSRAGLTAEDYPPVGKWDTDPRTGSMYVGMICGDKWCELAPEATTYSEQYTSTSTDRLVRRLREVKGWYDEQRLAVKNGEGVIPSSIVGTFAPSRNLGAYRESDFNSRRWLPAGTAVLSSGHPDYLAKLNFGGGPRANQIWLCSGSASKCIPTHAQRQVADCSEKHTMFAMIRSSLGDSLYKCVGYYHHKSNDVVIPIPGTVRWAWYDTDEGGWIRCPLGCCYPS